MRVRSAVAGLALVAVAGCAGVPSTGAVRIGRAVQPAAGGDAGEAIRVLPPAVIPGEAPGSLVRQFLRTMVDGSQNYGAARVYLAPGASWSPAGTTIYDDARLRVDRTTRQTVTVTAPRLGVIDPRGDFRPATGTVTRTFHVTKRRQQWKISGLASGVLLAASDAPQALQVAVVYYLNRALDTVVPEQLLVPAEQPGMATTLVRALLAGPGAPAAPGVRTAVPHGASLVGNVPIDGHGVAEVSLSGAVRQLAPNQLRQLSAQLVWTLRQVPGVSAVRLLDDGTPLTVPGYGVVQPVQAWAGFDPNAAPARQGPLFVRDGRVAAMRAPLPRALDGRSVLAPAVSADGSVVAALREGHGSVTLLGGPAAGPLHTWLTASRISPLVFAPGRVGYAAAATRSGGDRVLRISPAGTVTPLRVPPPARDDEVQAVAVSPDGSRIALVAGPPGAGELLVGVLGVRHDRPAIRGLHVVLPAARDVAGVAWERATEIVVTAAGAGRRVLIETPPDGYQPRTLPTGGLPNQPRQVAASPGQPVLAGANGAVWALSDSHWLRLSTGRDPSYAG